MLKYTLILSFLCCIQLSYSEIIKVGLEPFPPLINKDKSGYSIDLLREIEKVSDFKFKIAIMPYNRAKKLLKEGRVSLIGHTPYRNEVKEFYDYAKDLNWSIPAIVDLYSLKKISIKNYKKIKRIGVPRGNKEFFSELFKIPLENFIEGSLENLVAMLKRGRLNAVLFERAAIMSTIKKQKLSKIHYLKIDTLEASFAVRIDTKGKKLIQKLNKILKKVGNSKVYKKYYTEYLKLPTSGIVKI